MNQQIRQHQWLEAGKQIGKVFSYERDEVIYWSSIGIQKWEDEYKIYVSNIMEDHMSMAEDYLSEEIVKVSQFEDIPLLLASRTTVRLEELTPLKGQKVFNPKLD